MKIFAAFRTAVAVFIGLASVGFAAKPGIDVFILAGQSNMVGNGMNAELPAALTGPSPHLILVGGTSTLPWGTVRPGLGNNASAFGPEVGFAAGLPRASAIVKFAVSGTGLALDWAPGKPLYTQFIAFVAGAISDLSQDFEPHLRALVWTQGESDAMVGGSPAEQYLPHLVDFAAHVRADLGVEFKLVLNDLNQAALNPNLFAVRMAQHLAPEVIANCASVSTADFPTIDGLHYAAPALVSLGARLADAYMKPTACASVGTSPLVNQSVRSVIHPEDGPLMQGFVIGGTKPQKVLVRGIAGSLGQFGVKHTLPNPTLKIYNSQGVLLFAASTAPQYLDALLTRLGAFALTGEADACLLLELPPGAYSAHMADANGQGGSALLELYLVGS